MKDPHHHHHHGRHSTLLYRLYFSLVITASFYIASFLLLNHIFLLCRASSACQQCWPGKFSQIMADPLGVQLKIIQKTSRWSEELRNDIENLQMVWTVSRFLVKCPDSLQVSTWSEKGPSLCTDIFCQSEIQIISWLVSIGILKLLFCCKFDNIPICVLYPESFCVESLAVRKVFVFFLTVLLRFSSILPNRVSVNQDDRYKKIGFVVSYRL